MAIRHPTDRDRWAALALLLAAAGLAYLLLVHVWWTVPMLDTGARIQALEQRELRARMQLQQAPVVSRQLQAVLARQASGQPGLLMETTPERAAAWLVQRLETAVTLASPGNRGCAITNRATVPSEFPEAFPRVTVQVRMRCGIEELTRVLQSLENGTPRLFVENLAILAQRNYNAGTSGESAGLDVSFDLHGHIAPPAEKEVAGAG